MDEYDVEGRTYDYLRLSIVAVLLAIVASVFLEWRSANWCLQTSISAYYYTPVQAVFVGGLIALGVGMIVLHGRDSIEDAFLNLAGLFAPVVAFVPTVDANHCSLADGVAAEAQGKNPTAAEAVKTAKPAIDNNMSTFLAVVAAALAFMVLWRTWVFIARRGSEDVPSPKTDEAGQPEGAYVLTYVLGVLAWGVGVFYFIGSRQAFYEKAHGWSAALLCACVIVVVFEGARRRAKRGIDDAVWARMGMLKRFRYIMRDRYGWLWLSMMVTTALIVAYDRLNSWEHWILAVEVELLSFFTVFWILQTFEHWSGLKAPDKRSADQSTVSVRAVSNGQASEVSSRGAK